VPAVIGDVYYGLPAYQAGMKKGDTILQIEDMEIHDWYDLRDIIKNSADRPLHFVVQRGEDLLEMDITPQINIELDENSGMIGISQILEQEYIERFSVPMSLKYGFLTSINIIARYYSGISKLVQHPSQVGKKRWRSYYDRIAYKPAGERGGKRLSLVPRNDQHHFDDR